MPTCPSCGSHVEESHAFCANCGASLSAVPETIASPGTDEPDIEWTRFECEDGAFSVLRPADWRVIDPPVSEGASLCCAGPDRYTLLEGFAYERPPGSGWGQPSMASILAEGIEQTVGQEVGQSGGEAESRDVSPFRGAEAAMRIVASYEDRGLATTTDYFTVSTGDEAVMLAFKVLSDRYEEQRPIFEKCIESLSTLWL